MFATDIALLDACVTTIKEWSSQAQKANITLTNITIQFPKGNSVTFAWDPTENTYNITMG